MDAGMDGVVIRKLSRYEDARGWLTELFRDDEVPDDFRPAMSYLSITHSGIARGPHEHRDQTDGFAFVDGRYRLYLWENRAGHSAAPFTLEVGSENPVLV